MADAPTPVVLPGRASVEIERLGAQGDGIAKGPNGPVFIPLALPGETWAIGDDDYVRITGSPDRVEPSCRHFGTCGGCIAQHLGERLYADWKTGLVCQALAHQGIDIALEPLWQAPVGSRRRLVMSAVRHGGDVQVGFRAARSHAFVEVAECTIAAPGIVALFPALRSIIGCIAVEQGGLSDDVRIVVLLADNGIDVLVEGTAGTLSADARRRLADLAKRGDILRLTIGRDEIFQRARPILRVGEADIPVPAGAFVQAVGAAERAMTDLVVEALGRSKNVADLFCGLGTFALPIARKARVLAVDSEADAIAALTEAVRHAQGLKPVKSLRRDLFREPLSRTELNRFDTVVFDPPRAGAAEQSRSLAKSKVPCVVAVSCNPATLARDLRTLIDGGYKLKSVTPVDQFLYSGHIEAVAVLRR